MCKFDRLGRGLHDLIHMLDDFRQRASTARHSARLLFFTHDNRIGVVHGFIKKTRKTPPEDIMLARKRMKEMKG